MAFELFETKDFTWTLSGATKPSIRATGGGGWLGYNAKPKTGVAKQPQIWFPDVFFWLQQVKNCLNGWHSAHNTLISPKMEKEGLE